jgi:methionyl-tRNA synthetase
LGNEYITAQQPWTTHKQNQKQATAITLVHCIHLLRLFAIVSYPFIPASAIKILISLNDPHVHRIKETPFWKGLNFSYFEEDHLLQKPKILFDRIDELRVKELTAEFSGNAV